MWIHARAHAHTDSLIHEINISANLRHIHYHSLLCVIVLYTR